MGTTSEQLRRALAGTGMLEGPVIYDSMTARLAQSAGCDLVVLGAGGTANFLYGLPDMDLVSLPEVVANCGRICAAIDIPLIVDLDNGGATPAQVHRNVRLAEQAGAAAVMLEDLDGTVKHRWSEETQGWDFSTNTVRPLDEAVATIRAGVAARKSPDMMIMGRTDAYDIEGLDATVQRAIAYAEAGAELIFMSHVPYSAFTADILGAIPAAVVHMDFETPTLEERAELARLGLKGFVYAAEPILGALFGFMSALDAVRSGRPREDVTPNWERNKAILTAVDLKKWSSLD